MCEQNKWKKQQFLLLKNTFYLGKRATIKQKRVKINLTIICSYGKWVFNIGCKSVFTCVWALGNVSISTGFRQSIARVDWTIFQFFASNANNYENIAICDHHRDTDTLCRGNTNNLNDMWNALSGRSVQTLLVLMWLQILRSRQNRNAIFERLFRGILCGRHRRAHEFGHRLRLSSRPGV